MSRYKNKRMRRRDAIKAALTIAVIMLFFVAVVFGLDIWQTGRIVQTSSEETPEQAKEVTVTYQGQTYVRRREINTYLIMGIDEDGTADGVESYIGGGQADLQLLLVVDHARNTWQVLQLNRDSMVEVSVLGVTGKVIGTEFEQLAMAHSYGDGKEESCENTVETVSRLFENQPIDGYIALNMDAVSILNDMVGGVPVKISSDFSAVDPTLQEGTVVTLQGDQALTFVRIRQNVDDQTNLSRMARQRQYLSALVQQLEKQDEEFAIRAYDAVFDYMVTNMGSKTVTELGEYLKEYDEQPLLTIEGECQIEDGYVAYYLDEESLQQTMLTLFYEETDEPKEVEN